MKTLLNQLFLCLFLLLLSHRSFSQYILNGSAEKISCNCYTITNATDNQTGSVWNSNKISLANSFDFHFNIFLGCADSLGADGMVFVLQPLSTSIGTNGQGMGYEGVAPSIGISLDTWANPNQNDPWYDHISIQLNGQITHGSDLAGPIPISATSNNVEDCEWHVLRITWDANTKTIATYFDGQFRLSAQYDLVANVFNNDPLVYWGFSGATGSGNNLQQFCTSLNPAISANIADTAACVGQSVSFLDQSESFSAIQQFYWDFNDGGTSLTKDPTHVFDIAGPHTIKHAITGLDGCVSDTLTKVIYVGAKPVASSFLFDTCTEKIIGVTDQSTSTYGTVSGWMWSLDGGLRQSTQQPQFGDLPIGDHQIKQVVTTIYGCMSDTTTKNFVINPTPVVTINAKEGCWNTPISMSALQIDNTTNITQWNWFFDDGQSATQKDVYHTYRQGGSRIVHLIVVADNGCISNDTTAEVDIEDISVNAGRDTSVQSKTPFTLNAVSEGHFAGTPQYNWTPGTGLTSTTIANPGATLLSDQVYVVAATTSLGCIAKDTIRVLAFDFPGILVPSAFTPNHDGLNDILHARYNGIKNLSYFAIYNRWGQIVFKTSDMTKGWDGCVNDRPQNNGVFVWIAAAEDYNGRKYQLKGTVMILR